MKSEFCRLATIGGRTLEGVVKGSKSAKNLGFQALLYKQAQERQQYSTQAGDAAKPQQGPADALKPQETSKLSNRSSRNGLSLLDKAIVANTLSYNDTSKFPHHPRYILLRDMMNPNLGAVRAEPGTATDVRVPLSQVDFTDPLNPVVRSLFISRYALDVKGFTVLTTPGSTGHAQFIMETLGKHPLLPSDLQINGLRIDAKNNDIRALGDKNGNAQLTKLMEELHLSLKSSAQDHTNDYSPLIMAIRCMDARLPRFRDTLGIPTLEMSMAGATLSLKDLTNPNNLMVQAILQAHEKYGIKEVLYTPHTQCGVCNTDTLSVIDAAKKNDAPLNRFGLGTEAQMRAWLGVFDDPAKLATQVSNMLNKNSDLRAKGIVVYPGITEINSLRITPVDSSDPKGITPHPDHTQDHHSKMGHNQPIDSASPTAERSGETEKPEERKDSGYWGMEKLVRDSSSTGEEIKSSEKINMPEAPTTPEDPKPSEDSKTTKDSNPKLPDKPKSQTSFDLKEAMQEFSRQVREAQRERTKDNSVPEPKGLVSRAVRLVKQGFSTDEAVELAQKQYTLEMQQIETNRLAKQAVWAEQAEQRRKQSHNASDDSTKTDETSPTEIYETNPTQANEPSDRKDKSGTKPIKLAQREMEEKRVKEHLENRTLDALDLATAYPKARANEEIVGGLIKGAQEITRQLVNGLKRVPK